jgi:hypothetical protein
MLAIEQQKGRPEDRPLRETKPHVDPHTSARQPRSTCNRPGAESEWPACSGEYRMNTQPEIAAVSFKLQIYRMIEDLHRDQIKALAILEMLMRELEVQEGRIAQLEKPTKAKRKRNGAAMAAGT